MHHPLVAAHVYLGTINAPDFARLGGYCEMSLDNSGYPLEIGNDPHGNQVYTLGLGRLIDVGSRAIHDFVRILGIEEGELLLQEIRIPGELDIWAASKASWLPGGMGSRINRLISNYVLTREFPLIQRQVSALTRHVTRLRKEMNPCSMAPGA